MAGKDVIIDELVRDSFLYEKVGPCIGLLIGTYSEKGQCCVAHSACTLEEAEADSELQAQATSFTKIQLPTISHHAKQVMRMLPGGLLILGIFVIEDVDTIFTVKYQERIKSLLLVLNKSLSRNPHYGADFGKNNEKVFIHYRPGSNIFNVRVIDGNQFRLREQESIFARLEWLKLESEYDTFYAMHLAKADVGIPLKKNVKVLMDSFEENLNEAKFVVYGKLPSTQEQYVEQIPRVLDSGLSDVEDDVVGDHSESTSGGSGSSSPRHLSDSGNESETENPQHRPVSALHILIEKAPGLVRPTEPGQDFITHIHLIGKIATVGFVLKGSSTAFVAEMVKKDILRSLVSRLEMHCESLIEEEQGTQAQIDEGTTKVYHEVPRRVFANILGSKLLVSDYLFPGEGPKDSIVSFRDILSLYLDDEMQIIMTREKPFNMDELRSKGSLEELLCKVDPIMPVSVHRNSAFGVIFAITLAVALLGALVPMFLKSEE